jgi:hypothetical protein
MNKNRYSVSFPFIFSLLSLSITGCGDLKVTSYFNPSDPKLNRYKTLEIADFETEITDVPKEALTRISDEVAKLIVSKNIGFQKVERGSIEGDPTQQTLILVGEITGYESGKSFKEEGGALKFGEASLTVHVWLLDKNTGDGITDGEVSGLSTIGFLRSGFITKGVYEAIAQEIVKFISKNY